MIRKIFFGIVFLTLIFSWVGVGPKKVEAGLSCSSPSGCASLCDTCAGTCSYDCEFVSGSPEGSCYTSCSTSSGSCTAWTSWGPCGGGWQERYCTAPIGNNGMQIRSCTASPTPGPGGSSAPSCTSSNPAAPGLLSPANGASLANLSVPLSWSAPTTWGVGCPQDNKYNVYVGTVNPPTTLTTTTTATTATFGASPGTTYYWRVMAMNGSNGAYSVVRSFTTQASVSGTVFIDNGNVCSRAVTSTIAGLSARVRGTAYASTVSTANGTYSFLAPLGSYANLDLLGVPSTYVCSTGCLQSCPTKGTVTSQSSGNDFFLASEVAGWWQAKGASIYAGSTAAGVTVKSQLPNSSTSLILAADSGTPGALIRSSGTSSLGLGVVSNNSWTTLSKYRGKKMDYAYFSAQMGVIRGQASDWGASDTLTPQAYNASKDFWYMSPPSGTAHASTAWSVANGEKFVVFVNGDLSIENNITVANGGFIAFVVSGNVTVNPTVTAMHGIYISTGNFVSNSRYVAGTTSDTQLDVQGNVIAWGSLTLSRNLGLGNFYTPAEKFTFRPDLLVNMPDKMKVFAMQWQEVVAGTIE